MVSGGVRAGGPLRRYPAQLDASVLLRIPVRTSKDDRYFSDPWQAIPTHGYTRIFDNMLANTKPGIDVRLSCDFFQASPPPCRTHNITPPCFLLSPLNLSGHTRS